MGLYMDECASPGCDVVLNQMTPSQDQILRIPLRFACFIHFYLENDCFTMLCWVLLYDCVNQLEVYICPLLSEPLSHSPPHSSPLCCHRAQVWAPCVIQHLLTSIYFTYGNIYVSMLLSQFIPPPYLPTLGPQVCPLLTSLLLPCKQVHQYHFLDTIYIYIHTHTHTHTHTHILIYDICFSL